MKCFAIPCSAISRSNFDRRTPSPKKQKTYLRTTSDHFFSALENELMPLQLKESSNLPDNDVVFGDVQCLSHFTTMKVCVHERLNLHAAIDSSEPIPRSHTRLNHQVRHCIGNTNKTVTSLCSPALTRFVKVSCQAGLVVIEGSAMHRMNDGRHIGFPSCRSPKYSTFCAMRMHDVWLVILEELRQLLVCLQSFDGLIARCNGLMTWT